MGAAKSAAHRLSKHAGMIRRRGACVLIQHAVRNTGQWRSAHGLLLPNAKRRGFVFFSSFLDPRTSSIQCQTYQRTRFAVCERTRASIRKATAANSPWRLRAHTQWLSSRLVRVVFDHGFLLCCFAVRGCTCYRGHCFRGAPVRQPRASCDSWVALLRVYNVHV